MWFSMLFSGEQILSFKPYLVFYDGDFLRKMEDTRNIDFVTFEIWGLVIAALLLALMTIE